MKLTKSKLKRIIIEEIKYLRDDEPDILHE
jgi:hypothetical protein